MDQYRMHNYSELKMTSNLTTPGVDSMMTISTPVVPIPELELSKSNGFDTDAYGIRHSSKKHSTRNLKTPMKNSSALTVLYSAREE
jgi:hypothetical protein